MKRLGPNANTDDATHATMLLATGRLQDTPQILRRVRNTRILFADASSKRRPAKGLAPRLLNPRLLYSERARLYNITIGWALSADSVPSPASPDMKA